MFAIGTKDLVTGEQAKDEQGNALPPWIVLTAIEGQSNGDVCCVCAAPRSGLISILPEGPWTFGATDRGAYQRARQNGNAITFWTRPQDPIRTFMLIGLPNG